ncbi:hypothetical protein COL922a_014118, partial [Colletotrichum nupharicola]
MLLVPFALVASLALGGLIVVTFALEVFISEVYTGSLKGYLEFLPTVIFSLCLPSISGLLTSIATRLTKYENYRTQDQYDLAQTTKQFVMHFITAFLPTLLTAYAYVLSFGEEIVLPYVKRIALQKWREYRKQHATAQHRRQVSQATSQVLLDDPDESAFLARVRNEAEADEYNVHEDTLEMCVQFGYLTLFGASWPLVALGFLVNNWLELRGDFFKLSLECQRPPPIRADSIGPSLQGLEVLS